MVKFSVRKRGEDHAEEIDLDKYQGVLTAEIVGGSIRVKHLDFVRKEDKECTYTDLSTEH